MTDRIFIPDEAYRVKADYPEEPGEALVEEILAYISETGKPWEWHGHTHTPLPDGAIPNFLWSYEVPEFGVKRQAIAPCPHCSPTSAKYKRGVIAHFPDEAVIRLMGIDCFKALNPEAADAAQRSMKRYMSNVRDRKYLIAKLPYVDRMADLARQAQTQAGAADTFQASLTKDVSPLVLKSVLRAIGEGELRVREAARVPYRDKDGEIQMRDDETFVVHARVGNASALRVDLPPLLPRLRSLAQRLDAIGAIWRASPSITDMPADQRGALVRNFDRANRDLAKAFKDIEERRDLLKPMHLATLSRWSALPNAEVDVFLEPDETGLRLGKSRETSRHLPFPAGLRYPLPSLPTFAA